MNDMTPKQKITTGFWLGIGFIIPFVLASILGLVLSFAATPFIMKKSFESAGEIYDEESSEIFDFSNDDLKSQIKIVEFRESLIGNKLMILGVVTNHGPKEVGSINLQAELFDSEGKFVFECDEYISRKMKINDSENFQIRCGCGDDETPMYESLKLSVVSASNY